jgi:ERI1 exoribonuclease 2
LKWNGRAHCGLDDAFNTARLALELIRRGTNLTITGSLDPQPVVTKIRRPEWPVMLGHTDASDSLRNATSRTIDLANTGRDSMVCYCGVRCKRRLVKKPGPNCGKFFFACGRWTMADGDHCGFFELAGS